MSVCAAAQTSTTAAITGVIEDAGGSAVPGARLTLIGPGNRAEQQQVAGPQGDFTFLQLSTESYRLDVEASGYASARRQVLYAGTEVHLRVVLAPAVRSEVSVVATEEAEEPDAPAHVLISARQVDHMPTGSVSAPFSALLTMTAPGVSADSNGSFHPLGDHAEASFFLDGEPITDQQSRTFSNQVSLNTVQSIDVHEGSPAADVGDKTSMVILVQTRSGLDHRRPVGNVQFSRGSFATMTGGGRLEVGGERFGLFTAVDGVESARYLDTPETVNLHSDGNAENVFERLDFRATGKTRLQLNLGLNRSLFQTPNTFDQQALGQDQRQTIVSVNVAPQVVHTFGDHGLNQTTLWLRQDKVRYSPSASLFSDGPAYLEQSRRLTSTGLRTEFTHTHGRHSIVAGGELKHTFLAEQFATGLTDPSYNSPCLAADGSPSSATSIPDPAHCAAAGLTSNPGFLPGLLPFDLTRGGTIYAFRGKTDIKQIAFFGQDFVHFGRLQLKLGLRYDKYNGLVRTQGVQPRVGTTYELSRLHTVLRGDYARVFLTPYNENLILASSGGPGSPSASLGAAGSGVLSTATRNQFNTGFTTVWKHLVLSGEYFWKFTDGAYDFDVLLNSPLTFPTQFRKSKIDGGLVRLTATPIHGVAGFVTVSHTRSRLFGPQTGGVSFSAPYADVVRPDHDEGLAMNLNASYQYRRRGPWINASYRYDGGLVSVATPDLPTVLRLTGDEQQQMGSHCGAVFAGLTNPIRTCNSGLSATRIRIPAAGTYDADKNPARIAVRNLLDVAMGEDNLWTHEQQHLGLRIEAVNVINASALYNYLSTFSGTHFLTPRAVTIGLRYSF